ncbi:MAG: flagellar basal body L-ring protein FlgH [Gammaproteobacteria bacterium]|nr:flagellar basal body L-ring protein FlgH [Gammaproteobacteria bacterium]
MLTTTCRPPIVTHLINVIVLLVSVFGLLACSTEKALRNPDFAPTIPQPSPAAESKDGSIFSVEENRFLFEDSKARRPGDLITVLLAESTNASKSASTNSNKNTKVDQASPTLFGFTPSYKGKQLFQNNIDSDVAFSGSGDSSQSNKLSGEITVTIAEVYENGNMLVKGQKILTLNQGSEVVRVSGIVRPADITPENTVKSALIANAEITYSGKGAADDSNTAGWFTRFLGGTLWPF